jgi:hypothetical protein
MNDENITHAQRERVYVEGELAFTEGKPRLCNPYSASSSTLEQIWWNGWSHSRRRKQKERLLIDERDFTTHSGGKL